MSIKNKHLNSTKKDYYRLTCLVLIVLALCLIYLFVEAHPEKPKLFRYIISLRIPTLITMLIAAFAIGSASLIFQSIIQNRIVTPCLLGMNSLYTLIHTAIVFIFGSSSILASNANMSFIVDLIVMAIVATFIYSYMFIKTNYNILYVLLIGTVLTSLFGSMQTTMVRMMDPDEYDSLLSSLVADFNNVNAEIIVIAIAILIILAYLLRNELKLLNVIGLGREKAINLGVDYEIVVKKLLLGVVLAIAVATAVVGPISFLGLIIANLSRQFLKTYRHSYLIAGSALMGMIAIIAGQLISQHVYSYAVPVSTFITIGGGIYFLYLLLFKKDGI